MKTKSFWVLIVALYTFLFFPIAPLFAVENQIQAESDFFKPVIQYEPSVRSVVAGKPVVIQAIISGKVGIHKAILYYRHVGEETYHPIDMEVGENNIYSAIIPADNIKSPGIEYFIWVGDQAGTNVIRALSVFPFTPFMLTVTEILPEENRQNQVLQMPTPEERLTMKTTNLEGEDETAWYQKWWVWGLVGAVIVGAAAAGHGSNNNGGGGGNSSSGSVKITAPKP